MRDAISPSSAAAAAAGGVSWGRRKGGAPRLAANEGFVLPWLRTEEGRKRDLLRKKWRTSSRGPTCQRLSGRGHRARYSVRFLLAVLPCTWPR
jgi:hypothetical protein